MSTTYIPSRDFELPSDMIALADYRWNDRVVGHLFCKTCGIYPFHGDEEYGYRVNLGCVEGLDVLALAISLIDGRSMAIASDLGAHPGD